MASHGQRQVDQMSGPETRDERIASQPVQAGADRAAALGAVGVSAEEARLDPGLEVGRVVGRDARERAGAGAAGRMGERVAATIGQHERGKCLLQRRQLREKPLARFRCQALGAHLSGGIDSTIVVALMAGMMDQPVKTFSIGFPEERYSETKYARQVAEMYGTDHHEFVLEPDRRARPRGGGGIEARLGGDRRIEVLEPRPVAVLRQLGQRGQRPAQQGRRCSDGTPTKFSSCNAHVCSW